MLGAWVSWELVIVAAIAGVVLGVCVLAALYGAPLLRLRLAADEGERRRILGGELERVRCLEDAAAVLEEYGLDGAGELRTEAELRALLLAWAKPRGAGYQLRS